MGEFNTLDGFLKFERRVFGDSYPIATYDPFMIRFGEYRFVLDMLSFHPEETLLDLGCERNIFMLYLASLGIRVVGVDINSRVWPEIQKKKKEVERELGQELNVAFHADDATRLSLEPESVDKAIAISSVEHMFSEEGHGDQLAMASIARALKPGGLAVVTLPTSNGGPFHESPDGDERFAGPYRLYTPEAVEERILSQPDLAKVRLCYLAHSSPDPNYSHLHFFRFWMDALTPEERQKWAWANPILADLFNPIISQEEGEKRLETVNTVLICLRKHVSKAAPQSRAAVKMNEGVKSAHAGRRAVPPVGEKPMQAWRRRAARAFQISRTEGLRSLLAEVRQYIRWRFS